MLGVLIEVAPNGDAAAPPQGSGIVKADLRSIVELLSTSSKVPPLPSDDLRAEFDLILVDASSLGMRPDAADLAAYADLIILVARDGGTDATALRKARADLSRFSSVPTAVIVNRVPVGSAVRGAQGEALGLAS